MKYATIIASSYQEAMKKLRLQYGDDAFAISHKNIKQGGLLKSKLFAKGAVELTVGIPDRTLDGSKKKEPRGFSSSVSGGIAGGKKSHIDVTVGGKKDDFASLLKSAARMTAQETERKEAQSIAEPDTSNIIEAINRVKIEGGAKSSSAPSYSRAEDSQAASSSMAGLEKEFHELKETLNKLMNGGLTINSDSSSSVGTTPALGKYLDILKANDFDSDESESMIRTVKNSISNDELHDEYKIEKSLKELLKSRIVTSGPIRPGNRKKIVMLVGPTGVGKTTTLAKMGAQYSLKEGNKVAFITIDNYRIAATEQLKKYAEIMRIPIYSVNDQKEFKSIIASEKAEIILVDTSGRSQKNQLKISEIKSFADLIDYDFEKVLCVSANTRKSDLKDVFKAFDVINFNSVIITKVDETSNVGNVVDVADKYNKPISYFTNGQEVPNDIEVADSGKIVELMIGNINS